MGDDTTSRIAYLKDELRKYNEILINNITRNKRYNEVGLLSDEELDRQNEYWVNWAYPKIEDIVTELKFLMM